MKSYLVLWGLFQKPLYGSLLNIQYFMESDKFFFCGSLGKFANNKNRGAVKIHAHRLIGDNKIHSFLCELFLFQQYHTILGISPPILMSKGSKEGNEIMIQFLIH